MDNLCPNSSDHGLQFPETVLSLALKALIAHEPVWSAQCSGLEQWPFLAWEHQLLRNFHARVLNLDLYAYLLVTVVI